MMAECGSGERLPPFVVYKAILGMKNGPPGTRYSISKSGWFEAQTFVEWFRQIAVPYLLQLGWCLGTTFLAILLWKLSKNVKDWEFGLSCCHQIQCSLTSV